MSALARRTATVFTHARPEQTAPALERLVGAARRCGAVLRFDTGETRKHGLAAAEGVVVEADLVNDVDLCVVLGGDGTILKALRRYAGTGVPVFAVNFGEVGFLATLDPDDLDEGFDSAFAGEFEELHLPALAIESGDGVHAAINDVAIHRRVGERVAELAYAIDGEEVGSVRADGLVVCTPAGSTGYNLANGGPVLAWGVEGFGVSFIAPHSLTARALVVSPTGTLAISNRARAPVDVSVDGRPVGEIAPGGQLQARFLHDASILAQAPGSSFYRRLRTKFGRLSR